ncbi:hypothetical protein ACFLQX_00705 [Bacteroidota bacterium]
MKTRRFSSISMLFILSMMVWQGCTKTEVHQGSIDFGMNPLIESTLKSAEINRYDVVGALVSIVGEDGELIYNKEMLHFYTFGESFVTEKLKLDPGHFQLTEFLLIDSSRHILWATPLEGSRLAYLVDDPLPIEFYIESNTTTHLQPEVVWVGNHNPGDFGYVTFDVQFIDNLCIGVYYESACYDIYNDSMYLWYTDSILISDGIFAPIFPGKFQVFAEKKLIFETYIMPGYNALQIPRGYKYYHIVLTDCYQEKCFSETFSIEELRRFSCREGEALFIQCGSHPGEIIITPEDVLEPSIKQGVFGRLMIPYNDDSTFTEQYNFIPVIRNVHLYRIDEYVCLSDLIDYDTCVVWPIIDCLPDVIVRSNSSGYFQVELDVGTYLYMVETDYGYYIDLYISSRIPGILIIEPEKVTELKIMIQPCYDW